MSHKVTWERSVNRYREWAIVERRQTGGGVYNRAVKIHVKKRFESCKKQTRGLLAYLICERRPHSRKTCSHEWTVRHRWTWSVSRIKFHLEFPGWTADRIRMTYCGLAVREVKLTPWIKVNQWICIDEGGGGEGLHAAWGKSLLRMTAVCLFNSLINKIYYI